MSDLGEQPASGQRPPRLQALRESLGAITDHASDERPRRRIRDSEDLPRVVLAGGELGRRAAVNYELAYRMPDAVVLEADEVWEVLQQAPGSCLVVLAGDLDDAPAVALERLLAHRHPELTVLTLYGRPLDTALAQGAGALSRSAHGLTATAGA
jgi:hypothetical protein